mgnify:CR=1 FL=1
MAIKFKNSAEAAKAKALQEKKKPKAAESSKSKTNLADKAAKAALSQLGVQDKAAKSSSSKVVTETGTDFSMLESLAQQAKNLGGKASDIDSMVAFAKKKPDQLNTAISSLQKTVKSLGGEATLAKTSGGLLGTIKGALPQILGASGPGGLTDVTGTMFNTGNPAIDKWLNETWLPLVEAEFATDPSAVLNDIKFQEINDRIEKTFGPIFKKELSLVEETFNRNQEQLKATQTRTERELSESLGRGVEDIGKQRSRTQEEANITRERVARNFSEAMAESQAALADRGLTFGGVRQQKESRLNVAKDESLADVGRQEQRTLQDLLSQEGRLRSDVSAEQQFQSGQFGRSLGEMQSSFEKQKQAIEGEKLLQIASEKNRLRTLGASLLQNPQYF